jgi:hypothetical protein
MTKTKLIMLCAAVVVSGLVAAPAVFARQGAPETEPTSSNSAPNSGKTTEPKPDDTPKTIAEVEHANSVEVEHHNQLIEDRKQELRDQVKTELAAHTEKLDDKRKATCETHQGKINDIADQSATQNRKHLVKFQGIEARIKQFIADKKLTIANYDALVANIDDKEAAASAAIAVALETNFDCNSVDASNPGKTISGLMRNKQDTLKAYRTAIKELITAAKQALAATTEGGQQ